MHTITIYSKPKCSLCDAAVKAVQGVVTNHADVLMKVVDITRDPEFNQLYATDVPVVVIDGVERFKHRLDPDALAKLFYDEFGVKLIGF
jgi:glutaredoxin